MGNGREYNRIADYGFSTEIMTEPEMLETYRRMCAGEKIQPVMDEITARRADASTIPTRPKDRKDP